MTKRRPLHATLIDITSGILGATATAPVHARSVELTLPIDIRLPQGEEDLIGELPLFRMRTDFDPEPATLHILIHEVNS